MKIKRIVFSALFFAAALFILPSEPGNAFNTAPAPEAGQDPTPQDTQRPGNDYMTSLISRGTQPLGLKDDPGLQKYLAQPGIKWAVRSCRKHILNFWIFWSKKL